MKNKLWIMGIAIAIVSLLTFVCGVSAQEQGVKNSTENEKEVTSIETFSGEVSAINKTGIAVVYEKDYETGAEKEIFAPIDENTVLKHVKTLDEIKVGDLVSVEYQKSNKNPSRTLSVSFIQHAPAGLVATEGVAEDNVDTAVDTAVEEQIQNIE